MELGRIQMALVFLRLCAPEPVIMKVVIRFVSLFETDRVSPFPEDSVKCNGIGGNGRHYACSVIEPRKTANLEFNA